MAKNNVADLDTTAANNSDFAGTDSTGTTGLVKNGDNILRTIGSMLKKWWNDLGAQVTVGGTANAITITSSSTYQSLASGIRILFKPSADNSGATTLNLDSLGVKAVRKISGGTDVALTAKDLLNGKRAELVYDSSANAADGAWILLNAQGDQLNLPSGGVIDWNNGDVTVTHSPNALAFAGASSGYSFDALVDVSGAAAGRIKFPATQNPSSDANTLDDYEEGTFTPALAFGGSSTGVTYTTQAGQYAKIGQFVYFTISVVLTNNGSGTGSASITGLPFTNRGFDVPCPVHLAGGGATASGLYGLIDASATTISLWLPGATIGTRATDTNITNSCAFNLSGQYRVSA